MKPSGCGSGESAEVERWAIVAAVELVGLEAAGKAREILRNELEGVIDDAMLTDLMLGE